jgi:uncharacterized protein
MRWRDPRRSGNVQDRRGMRVPMVGGGIAGLVILIISVLLGGDPGAILNGGSNSGSNLDGTSISSEKEQQLADFVSIVLADTEDTWNAIFAENDLNYREPTLVLFTDAVESGCGVAQSAVGPFYCPVDETVYIDLSFYKDLKDRFGAPGDFAQAYVIAHEVGHHVQNQLGIMDDVQTAQQRANSQAEANELSVKLELQADCLAGVWGYHAERSRDVLESGDVEEGLNAASAIGDDRLTQGRVAPDSFTHGTSQQRVDWFKTGLDTGSIDSCNTFELLN